MSTEEEQYKVAMEYLEYLMGWFRSDYPINARVNIPKLEEIADRYFAIKESERNGSTKETSS